MENSKRAVGKGGKVSFLMNVKADFYGLNCVLLIMLAPVTVLQGGCSSVGGWYCVRGVLLVMWSMVFICYQFPLS